MGRSNMYIYPFYIADIVAAKDIENIAGDKVKEILMVNEKGFTKLYYEIDSANKIGKFFLEKIIKDKTFYKKAISKIYKYS